MLFSDQKIATYINSHFEPVWQSVRPVPIVHVDFGNGNVLTRTLNGNIATFICAANGQVLDVLPGMYDPDGYLSCLKQMTCLPTFIAAAPDAQKDFMAMYSPSKKVDQTKLANYHVTQANRLEAGDDPFLLVWQKRARSQGFGKSSIESPMKVILAPPGVPVLEPGEPTASQTEKGSLANWKLLKEDSAINEHARRAQIHRILASLGSVQPAQVSKRIYKEVLHADLDDPYLGLGHVLSVTYPFKDSGNDSSRGSKNASMPNLLKGNRG